MQTLRGHSNTKIITHVEYRQVIMSNCCLSIPGCALVLFFIQNKTKVSKYIGPVSDYLDALICSL